MGRPMIDLRGKRFNRLEVLQRDTSKPSGASKLVYWICKCDCGNEVSVRGDHLRNGTTQSCGCLNSSGEEKITKILQAHNIHYKTQYSFKDLQGENNSLLRFDFAIFDEKDNLICLIEYQGQRHYKPWGNETQERFEKRQLYDKRKQEYCTNRNINLITIPYTDFDILDWQYLCDKIELKRQFNYLESMFVDNFNNDEIINSLIKVGNPNPISKGEMTYPLFRNYLQ